MEEKSTLVKRIEASPHYAELRHKRNLLGGILTVLMLLVYFGYIALIAFNKPFLAQRIGDTVLTLGVPIAFGVIIFTVLITAFYIWQANRIYDTLIEKTLQEANA